MTPDTFWKVIDDARTAADGAPDSLIEHLHDALDALPEAEIIAFDRILDERRAEAYRWPLWGAAYLLNGGCSDAAAHCPETFTHVSPPAA